MFANDGLRLACEMKQNFLLLYPEEKKLPLYFFAWYPFKSAL